jgi:hypothetical protein
MSKLLSVLIAATFATVSFSSIASAPAKDDKKMEACKKMDAKADDKMKAECKKLMETAKK